jgi:NAD(P)-dependent dehydrogenase (short-subunit alcohol dehydrogenase family)
MDLGFKGKVAMVTGAGSQVGFGKEIAILMAKEGCDKIAVSDVNMADVEKTAAALKAMGCQSLAVKADITQKGEVTAMVDKVLAEFGRVDILCNVAGGILHKDNIPLDQQDQEIWTKQMNLNLFGTMRVSQAVLPSMRKQNYGVIVNIGSGSTHQMTMGVGVYAMSKYSMDLFTRQLAMTEAKNNIRVNCVAPGPAPTNFGAGVLRDGPPPTPEQEKQRREFMVKMFPLGRIGTAADIAYATAFLASDVTCNVTAQIFHVSGGLVVGD